MEIDATPLYKEAVRIQENESERSHVVWRIRIHLANGKTIDPISSVAVNLWRRYKDSYGDEITVTAVVGLGDYAREIYPNRSNIEITLVKLGGVEASVGVNANKSVRATRYHAVLLTLDQSPTIAQGAESNSQDSLNLGQLMDVNFQLIEKPLVKLGFSQTGGTYRDITIGDALKSNVSQNIEKLGAGSSEKILGMEVVPADNLDKKAQVQITDGTRMVDVPDYLQKKYGLYNSGLGSYVQDRIWHIFPLYNTMQFKSRTRTATLVVMPKRKFTGIERTYLVEDLSTSILVTGNTSFTDDAGTRMINTGNGVRYVDANTLTEAVKAKSNSATLRRSDAVKEFVGAESSTGTNHIAVSKSRIVSNPFHEFSHIAAKNGGLFTCNWQNSDINLLQPGMAMKILYMDKDQVKTIYGVLLQAEQYSVKDVAFTSESFNTQAILRIFVNAQLTPNDE